MALTLQALKAHAEKAAKPVVKESDTVDATVTVANGVLTISVPLTLSTKAVRSTEAKGKPFVYALPESIRDMGVHVTVHDAATNESIELPVKRLGGFNLYL